MRFALWLAAYVVLGLLLAIFVQSLVIGFSAKRISHLQARVLFQIALAGFGAGPFESRSRMLKMKLKIKQKVYPR